MAKTTDTRERVRELAAKIYSEGGTPTPTLIRTLLGKGSPNTIVDELKAIQRERDAGTPALQKQADARQTASALESIGLHEISELISSLAEQHARALSAQRETDAQLAAFNSTVLKLAAFTEIIESLLLELRTERDWFKGELSKQSDQFAGVQKIMLTSIDSAREDAKRWKAAYEKIRAEFLTWQSATATKVRSLQAQLNDKQSASLSYGVEDEGANFLLSSDAAIPAHPPEKGSPEILLGSGFQLARVFNVENDDDEETF